MGAVVKMGWGQFYKEKNRGIAELISNVSAHKEFIKTIVDNAPIVDAKETRLLEVGTGTADMCIFMSWLGYKVTSIDNDQSVLENAMSRDLMGTAGDLKLLKQDAFNLSFSDKTFDIVFSQGFLEHFSDEEIVRLIAEQLRVGKKVIKVAVDKVKARYKINRDYILFVGTLEPRKNITNIIRAYNMLPHHLKYNHLLVICGKKGWYYEEIFRTVEELNLEDNVIFTGYVPDKDVPLLMNGAKVFVYPSFYEGFGLPPLEAMACGTPVISSNVSSIPEVVGNAGILVNPNNVEELSDAIVRVVSNEELRAQLSEKGLRQANKFSWRATVEKTVEVYNRVGFY